MRNFCKAGLMVLLACLLVGNAWADRPGRSHHYPRSSVQFGIYLGGPWIYPPYYPYPMYPAYPVYVPRVYAPPAPPPVYIEQQAMPAMEPGYWYYCNEAQAYYPYVRECPGPWQRVAPQPPQ
ncbi:MAG: hypothetical protein Q8L56_04625 [Rhodocyclaceae bacterium]|nr:hypothetical protein [Rhodocyclaceae bacterium]